MPKSKMGVYNVSGSECRIIAATAMFLSYQNPSCKFVSIRTTDLRCNLISFENPSGKNLAVFCLADQGLFLFVKTIKYHLIVNL